MVAGGDVILDFSEAAMNLPSDQGGGPSCEENHTTGRMAVVVEMTGWVR
jgi:hypothetical protein